MLEHYLSIWFVHITDCLKYFFHAFQGKFLEVSYLLFQIFGSSNGLDRSSIFDSIAECLVSHFFVAKILATFQVFVSKVTLSESGSLDVGQLVHELFPITHALWVGPDELELRLLLPDLFVVVLSP